VVPASPSCGAVELIDDAAHGFVEAAEPGTAGTPPAKPEVRRDATRCEA